MKPQIKALIALPFAVAAIAAFLTVIVNHPIVVAFLLGVPAVLGLLSFIWYVLYVMFGGTPL